MEYKFTNAPVDLDALPDHQQLVYTPTLKARLYKALLVIGLFYIVLIIGILLLRTVSDVKYLIPALCVGVTLVFLLMAGYQFLLQKQIGYALREHDIAFRRGVIFEKITLIPFNRIQHISTSAGVLDKAFKIANLNIFTAGGSGSDINIPGLNPDMAARLKDKVAQHLTEADV